jgi:hypothetical protein
MSNVAERMPRDLEIILQIVENLEGQVLKVASLD